MRNSFVAAITRVSKRTHSNSKWSVPLSFGLPRSGMDIRNNEEKMKENRALIRRKMMGMMIYQRRRSSSFGVFLQRRINPSNSMRMWNKSPPVAEIDYGLEPTDRSEVSRDPAKKGKAVITDTTLMTSFERLFQ